MLPSSRRLLLCCVLAGVVATAPPDLLSSRLVTSRFFYLLPWPPLPRGPGSPIRVCFLGSTVFLPFLPSLIVIPLSGPPLFHCIGVPSLIWAALCQGAAGSPVPSSLQSLLADLHIWVSLCCRCWELLAPPRCVFRLLVFCFSLLGSPPSWFAALFFLPRCPSRCRAPLAPFPVSSAVFAVCWYALSSRPDMEWSPALDGRRFCFPARWASVR